MYSHKWPYCFAILLAAVTLGATGIGPFNPGLATAQTPRPALAEGFEFSAATPVLRYHFPRKGLKATVYKGTWIAEKVEGAKPEYEIASAEVRLGREPVATFTLTKPENGWPAGFYRLEIRGDSRLVHTERFSIR